MVAQAVATIALGVLGASGIVKLIDPDPTTGAMSTVGLPASNTLSRLLGIVEIVVAVIALAAGGLAVIAAAGLYAAFAVFTVAALRLELPIQSCGCFGRDDTPPTILHVAYNSGAAAALFTLPVLGLAPIEWGLAPLELALFVGFAAVGVYASYLLLATLPQLLGLARNP
ncbi:MAG TPA: MauE/DoxX family redox-associated membrane protein [Acidimicrobiia bacterium]|nr:MauE/DoxX family redox-associated membrane protein [Acidimicrobiia bacterium]